MAEVTTYVVKVTTTGVAGSASGNTDSDMIAGYLEDVYIDFHGSAPATTDVTISFKGRGGNVLATTNTVTDAFFAPRRTVVDNTNSPILNAYDKYAIWDKLNISVAQSDALTDAVTVYIRAYRPS